MFDEFIQTYLSYLIDHLLCMIEQSKTSVREAHDEAANLTNLIYLWSRKFVQNRIYSNTINMSMVSYFLDLTAVEAIADMKYESEDVSGRFIAVSSYPNKCEIKLKDTGTQVRLNEMKKVRKLLEITYQSGNDGLYLLYNRKISINKLIRDTNTDFKVIKRMITGDLVRIDIFVYIIKLFLRKLRNHIDNLMNSAQLTILV